ncbi:DNA methyltransferase [Rhodococcus sp. 105337]|uniref:DNA methyltransferase n=1 Tax=Rhodococcus sp. 105337 TaxID=2725310 RepID=UPI00146CACC2|nr:DNA methyltransferase [Rhodococcus sp. 105337]NME81505.1 DNA methylase [Rhodococcus sp. 105337]
MTRVVNEPYRREVTGGKGSIFYRTHSYHTKVPPEGVIPMLEHYTDPGDVVLDPFCGSGMIGVACLLAGRRGILSDLSPAAVHIATGHTTKADPAAIKAASTTLLNELADLEQVLYGTTCRHCAASARIEYTVWSDTLECPSCSEQILFWDAARQNDGTLSKTLCCPRCAAEFRKAKARIMDGSPVLVSVACPTCRQREQRPLTLQEQRAATRSRRSDITDWYPTAPLDSWREMWRGQHRDLGIATAADFFTDRNLQALAAVWEGANRSVERSAMRFAVTAIVNRASRRYQWNPKRPTNVLSGTLYIASLTYEFNVFSLLRRKFAAVAKLKQALVDAPGSCTVNQSSATELTGVEDKSVDYVFTDPPFGANIYYSDASFLWEAWLDAFTATDQEAVVSTSLSIEHGRKTLQDYEKLMASSFSEVARILKPGAWASVMFHNSDDAVWSSLERAIESADLSLESAIAFDKSQPSFKGIKQITDQERVSSFDLVLHLRTVAGKSGRRVAKKVVAPVEETTLVAAIGELLATAPPRRRTTPYIHSFVMRLLLERGGPLTGWSYRDVEALLEAHFINNAGTWATQPRDTEEMA